MTDRKKDKLDKLLEEIRAEYTFPPEWKNGPPDLMFQQIEPFTCQLLHD